MDLGLFILYYLLCTFVLFIIILFVFRFIFKRKFNLVSRIAQKTIDDYFKAYDDNLDIPETLDLNDNFDEQIHIIEEDTHNVNEVTE